MEPTTNVTIKLSDDLLNRLRALALSEHRSLNKQIAHLLEQSMKGQNHENIADR